MNGLSHTVTLMCESQIKAFHVAYVLVMCKVAELYQIGRFFVFLFVYSFDCQLIHVQIPSEPFNRRNWFM